MILPILPYLDNSVDLTERYKAPGPPPGARGKGSGLVRITSASAEALALPRGG